MVTQGVMGVEAEIATESAPTRANADMGSFRGVHCGTSRVAAAWRSPTVVGCARRRIGWRCQPSMQLQLPTAFPLDFSAQSELLRKQATAPWRGPTLTTSAPPPPLEEQLLSASQATHFARGVTRPITRGRDVTVEPKRTATDRRAAGLRRETGPGMAKKLIEIHKDGEIVTVSW